MSNRSTFTICQIHTLTFAFTLSPVVRLLRYIVLKRFKRASGILQRQTAWEIAFPQIKYSNNTNLTTQQTLVPKSTNKNKNEYKENLTRTFF